MTTTGQAEGERFRNRRLVVEAAMQSTNGRVKEELLRDAHGEWEKRAELLFTHFSFIAKDINSMVSDSEKRFDPSHVETAVRDELQAECGMRIGEVG